MKPHFFNPKKTEISKNLVLVPFFPEKKYLKKIEERAIRKTGILGSMLYGFSSYDMLYGFLGYPNILTLLEYISNIREKNIFFLGTAGSLNPDFNHPELLKVERIYPGSIFKYFSDDEHLTLNSSVDKYIRNVDCISVDLIQREDEEWYNTVRKEKIDAVEMELYPLRWFLGREFSAYVVLSDQISDSGIVNFDRKKIAEISVHGFELIERKFK